MPFSSTASCDEERVVLSFYELKTLPMESLPLLQQSLKENLSKLGVKGRIYISPEGFNAQVSVAKTEMDSLKQFITQTLPLKNLYFNESTSIDDESF